MRFLFLIAFFASTLACAGEVEREIKYLGNNGTAEVHEVICTNGKTGIVKVSQITQDMIVEIADMMPVNIGKSTFSEAEVIICG